MTTSNLKWLVSISIAVGITMTNIWILNNLVDHGRYGLMFSQVWSGIAVMFGLGYAAGVGPYRPNKAPTNPTDGPSWLKVASWTFICCSFPWISLPGSGSLGLPAAVLFFVLIWREQGIGPSRSFWRTAMLAGFFGFALLIALLVSHSPYRLARLVADFSGPLDLEGRHYFHGIVLRALFGVRMLGEASNALPLHFERINTLMLLRFAHSNGALPAAMLSASLLIAWQQLHAWLKRVAPGKDLSFGMKRFGLALIKLHGIATLCNVLWNFGLTRQPFGPGLPPFTTHSAWWVLSACLVWVLVLAWRQHVHSTEAPTITQRLWRTAVTQASFAVVASFGLLIAVNSAKDVYAANRTPDSNQIVRRDITDRHGLPIATSTPAFDLWLTPNQFWGASLANPRPELSAASAQTSDQQRRSQLLSTLESWPQLRAIVEGRMNSYGKSDEQQKILAWAINPELAEKITTTGLRGLRLTPRQARHYPEGGLFAHVLGFTSLADPSHGQEGLELTENLSLLHLVSNRDTDAPPPLHTTLDLEFQRAAASALNEGIASHGAIGGSAIVIEASSGKIRAMASAPGFNPNDNSSYRNPYQPERMLNRARGVNFPIGSLMTPLLAAHMIETGRMKPSTTIAIGPKLTVGKATITDVSPSDTLTLTEVVSKSSNIGQAKLALSLPLAELRDVTRHLGIGEPLQIRGLIGNMDYESIKWSNWNPQMGAQPGLHITTNLVQAMRAFLPLANGGRLAPISLIETPATPAASSARVLSEATVKAMRDILSASAGPTGTAPLAQLPDVMVAGKTGTTVSTNGHPVTTFIGMAPADKPRYLIGVLLEFRSQHIRLAGSTAAPVFARLLEKIIASEKAKTPPEPDRQFVHLAPAEQPNT